MSTQPQTPVSVSPSPARVAAIQEAVARWERQLVDNTAGSPLLMYRPLKAGTLDLTPGEDREISRSVLNNLLGGRRVHLSALFPADPAAETAETAELDDARKRLTSIARKAQTYREEKGTDTLFLAAGLATWEREGSGRPPNAPVILLPLAATPEGAAHREFALELAGDAAFNPVLRQELRTAYGIELSDDLLENPPASYADMAQFLQELAKAWATVPGLRIAPQLAVRDFHYTNMPLVDDLKNNADVLAANDVVAAIAGVAEARNSLNAGLADPPPGKPDIDPPESEFLILDADSSQHRAINRALAGQSVVIWGPPGTGKSQTIANLIAALIAQSKRVLFVAQKQAAVEVVANRLQRVGLSALVMDCHGGIKSKRDFARGLADSIQSVGAIPARDYSRFYQELADRRQSLLAYADALHRLREPWQISAFAAQVGLMNPPAAAMDGLWLQSDKALGLSREAVTRLKGDVQRWIDLGGPYLAARYPEWANAPVAEAQDARLALELAQRLADYLLPRCRSLLAAAAQETGLTLPDTPAAWPALLKLLAEVQELSARFKPGLYALNHPPLVAALRPRGNIFNRLVVNLSGSYRAAKSAVTAELRAPGRLSGNAAWAAVEQAARQVDQWRSYQPAAPAPVAPNNLADLQGAVAALLADLETLEKLAGNPAWRQQPAGPLAELLARMGNQRDLAARLPQLRELERGFQAAGFAPVIAAIGKEIGAAEAPQVVEYCWFKAVWDEIVFNDPLLAGFAGDTHSRHRADFANYDRQHLEHSPERIKRAAAELAAAAMNQFSRELDLLRREGAKRTRHLSVRELFRRTPHLLTALRPCWMMSPLQVAELVPVDRNLFDVVIFDEASQIPPAEAIGSLARAPQFIVAGDERQLPPTNFFARAANDGEELTDEEEEGTELALTADIESILDAVKALPVREQMLQWHYRSRDGRLIAFSNTHIYGDALTAFPGTARETPIAFHQIALPAAAGASTVSHPEEVAKAVDLIIDHARRRPQESLGVIAFGIRHANNIEEALRRRLNEVKDPALDNFFAEDAAEKFFVKNIERVQGDERDAIILSVGYHKAANGTLPYRFGPLNQEGGERRLNVAITRARSRIDLVCAFSHHDMEPGRSNARGVELLRQYLEFAASGGAELGGTISGEALNAFELDVLYRLTERGIPATPQYGVAGYRIDFACAHPDQPGRMVLAIEADGASYHSTPTARERDRLRQEVLENLGWRFHRIWSTDWFRNREEMAAQALAAWRQAVALADKAAAGPPVAPPPTEVSPPPAMPAAPAPPGRAGPCPIAISPGEPITAYRPADLTALARWIMSDTLLRTDDELMLEMRRALGFKRSGSRINAALRDALAAVRRP